MDTDKENSRPTYSVEMYVFVYWLDIFYVEPPWHGWKCKTSRWETELNLKKYILFLSENYNAMF